MNKKRNIFIVISIIFILLCATLILALQGPHGNQKLADKLGGEFDPGILWGTCAQCHKVHGGLKSARLWYEDISPNPDKASLVERLCRFCHTTDGLGNEFTDIEGTVHERKGHIFQKSGRYDKDGNLMEGFDSMYSYELVYDTPTGGSLVSCYVCHDPHGSQYFETHEYIDRTDANTKYSTKYPSPTYDTAYRMRLADNYFVTRVWRNINPENSNLQWDKKFLKSRLGLGFSAVSKTTYREFAYGSTELYGDRTVNIRDLCFNCHRPEGVIQDPAKSGAINIWGDTTVRAEEYSKVFSTDTTEIVTPPIGEIMISSGRQLGDVYDTILWFYNKTTIDSPGPNAFYDNATHTCVTGCHNPIVGEEKPDVPGNNEAYYNTAYWYSVSQEVLDQDVALNKYETVNLGKDETGINNRYGTTYLYYSKLACVSCHNQHGEYFRSKTTHHPYDSTIPLYISRTDGFNQDKSRRFCLGCHDEHIKFQAPRPVGLGVTVPAIVPAHFDDTTSDVRNDLCTYCHSWDKPLIIGGSVCGSCHGFPPNYFDDKKNDKPGVHETHVIAEGYSCITCHYKYQHNQNKIDKPEDFRNPDKPFDSSFINVTLDSSAKIFYKTIAEYGKPFDTAYKIDRRYNRRRGTHTYGYIIFNNVDYQDTTLKKMRPLIPDTTLHLNIYSTTSVRLTFPYDSADPVRTEIKKFSRSEMCLMCHDNEVVINGILTTGYKYPIDGPYIELPLTINEVFRKPLPIINIQKYYFLVGHGTSFTSTRKKPHNPFYNQYEDISRTDCTDCHVPHGSDTFPLIREWIKDPHKPYNSTATFNSTTVASDNRICYACHSDRLDNGFWPGRQKYETSIHYQYYDDNDNAISRVFDRDTSKPWVTDFSQNPKYGDRYRWRFRHDSTMSNNGSGVNARGGGRCVNCHNPHGDGSSNINKPTYDIMDSSYKNMTNYGGSKLCYRCHVNPAQDNTGVSRVAWKDVNSNWNDYNTTSWIDADIQRQFESTREPNIRYPGYRGSHHDVGGTRYNSTGRNWVQRGDWGYLRYNNGSYYETVFDWRGYDQIINLYDSSGDDSRIECINCHNPHIVQRDNPYTTTAIESLINPDPNNGVHPDSVNKESPYVEETKFDTFFLVSGLTRINKQKVLNRFCLRCHDHDANLTSHKDFDLYSELDPPEWLYNYDSLQIGYEIWKKNPSINPELFRMRNGISAANNKFYGELPRAVVFPKIERNIFVWEKWDKSWFYFRSGHGKFEDNPGNNYDTTTSCMGCHYPHGSYIPKLLRTDTTDTKIVPQDNGAVYCYRCHEFPINNGFWNGKAGWNDGPNRIAIPEVFAQYQKGFDSSIHSKYPKSFESRTFPNNKNVNMYNSTLGYDTSDAGKCINCHDPHGTVRQSEGNGYYQTMGYPNMTYGYKENLCYDCHDDKATRWKNVTGDDANGMDLKSIFGSTNISRSRHDVDTTSEMGGDKAWDTTLDYILGANGVNRGDDRRIECISCHNVHVITGKYETGKIYTPVTHPENPALLIRDYDTVNNWRNGRAMNTFCLECHDTGWDTTVNLSTTVDRRYKSPTYLILNNEFLPRPVVFPNSTTIVDNSYDNQGDQPADRTIWWAGNKKRFSLYYNKAPYYYINGHGSDSTRSYGVPDGPNLIRVPMNVLCIDCHDPHASTNIKLIRDIVLRFIRKYRVDTSLVTNYKNKVRNETKLSRVDPPGAAGRAKELYCNWACHNPEYKHIFTYVRDDDGNYYDWPSGDPEQLLVDTTSYHAYRLETYSATGRYIKRGDLDVGFAHGNDYLPGQIGYKQFSPKFTADQSDVDEMKDTFNPVTNTYLAVDSSKVIPVGGSAEGDYYRLMCLTCHNPHGTTDDTTDFREDRRGMTVYDPDSDDINLCAHCHWRAR